MRRFWRRFRSRFQSDKAPEEGLDSEETVSVALLAVGDFPWAYATDPPKKIIIRRSYTLFPET